MARTIVPVPMRWSDIDGYGHVNNAAMFTLLEEARIATFWNIASQPADGEAGGSVDESGADQGTKVLAGGVGTTSHTLVARQEIEYTAPLTYSADPVRIHLWVGRIGGASLEVCYEVYDPTGQLCAKAATSIVMVDAASGRPRKLTSAERAALTELVEDPITFRR